MGMTRLTIRGLVEDATGRTDKTSLINSAIDIAVEEVSTQHLWSDLLVSTNLFLVVGSTSKALASDVARVVEMRVIDNTLSYPLKIRPRSWVVRHFPNPSAQSTGKPSFAYIEGQTLFTVPLPDAIYEIQYAYFKMHVALSTDASEVTIRHAGPSVVAYTTFWVFQSIEKHEEAQKWLVSYLQLLESAKKLDRANSAVKHVADQRGRMPVSTNDYWLDPFVKEMP